ncbi:MAG: lipase family protein [Candidatus Binataceae bacterium]
MWDKNPSIPCDASSLPQPGNTVANAQDLVKLIWQRYNTGKPIGVYRVVNMSTATCLMVLSGTQPFTPQSTGPLEDVASALGMNDGFRQAIIEHMGSADFASVCPPGSRLILAGHSLGGMEAQLVAADPRTAALGYQPMAVITFGSPKVAPEAMQTNSAGGITGFTLYRRFTTIGDPIPYSTRGLGAFQPTNQIYVDDRSPAQKAQIIAYTDGLIDTTLNTRLGLLAWIAMGAMGPHMAYPCVRMLADDFDALGNRISSPGSGTQLILAPAPDQKFYSAPSRLGVTPLSKR